LILQTKRRHWRRDHVTKHRKFVTRLASSRPRNRGTAIHLKPNDDGRRLVGIDNRAAGATAALLLKQFVGRSGSIMVISESMQSRDSLERRLGFDDEINLNFPLRAPLPRNPMAMTCAPKKSLQHR
jgi:hypothetical protein